MIKTGVKLTDNVSPELLRLLSKHPDVEICWLDSENNGTVQEQAFFETLQGEIDSIPVITGNDESEYDGLDLYIGPDSDEFATFYGNNRDIKHINLSPVRGTSDILGVCELNRKAMVRGGRSVWMPDTLTLLGSVALMPLAKNLLLNSSVSATVLLPSAGLDYTGFRILPGSVEHNELAVLRNDVLSELQTSFNAPIEITTVDMSGTSFACAIVTANVKMSLEQTLEIYKDFYSDHRHIFFPKKAVTDRMVMDTNKTAVRLHNDSLGRFVITVAFDARYKGGAGNIVHILNLLFGLDERTGL